MIVKATIPVETGTIWKIALKKQKTAGEWEIDIGMLTTLRYCWMFEVCHFETKTRLGPLNWGNKQIG